MKLLIAIALATSSLASFASQLPESSLTPATLIREIHSQGNLMPGPGVGRKVHTDVTFVVSTCRHVNEADYKLVVTNTTVRPGLQVSNISLKFANGIFADCFGPAHETELRLETTEIPPHASVVLTNPLLRTTSYVY